MRLRLILSTWKKKRYEDAFIDLGGGTPETPTTFYILIAGHTWFLSR